MAAETVDDPFDSGPIKPINMDDDPFGGSLDEYSEPSGDALVQPIDKYEQPSFASTVQEPGRLDGREPSGEMSPTSTSRAESVGE